MTNVFRGITTVLAILIGSLTATAQGTPPYATCSGNDEQGFPRQDHFPRSPEVWFDDEEYLNDIQGSSTGTDAFRAINPNANIRLVDPTYVALNEPHVYPAPTGTYPPFEAYPVGLVPTVIAINRNDGASAGDSETLGWFRHDGTYVVSMHSRQVNHQAFMDSTLYPQYAWLHRFRTVGITVRLGIVMRSDPQRLVQEIWSTDEWPAPYPESTVEGKEGFLLEWRCFDLSARVPVDEDFALVLILENPHQVLGSIYFNLTRTLDYGAFYSVPNEDETLARQSRLEVWPNPTRSGQLLLVTGVQPSESWTVWDAQGRRVAQGSGEHIQTSGFAPGVYRLMSASGTVQFTVLR